MSSNTIFLCLGTCLIGFVAGFFFANSLNRSETSAVTPQETQTSPTGTPSQQDITLSADEIKQRIDAADGRPNDFVFQRNLGLSLYRYASIKQDATIMADAIRILERALTIDPADRDLQIGLGNAYFEKAYLNKDNKGFETARKFFLRALERVPTDVDVRTDLGLTYYFYEPADMAGASAQFEKALTDDPAHQRSMQFLIQAYVKLGETKKAADRLAKLRSVNPVHPALNELTGLISNAH